MCERARGLGATVDVDSLRLGHQDPGRFPTGGDEQAAPRLRVLVAAGPAALRAGIARLLSGPIRAWRWSAGGHGRQALAACGDLRPDVVLADLGCRRR